jgi:pimeloyl-ACP methyl ester carboxylesterase
MDICPYREIGLTTGPPILFMSGFPDSEVSAWGKAIPEELGKHHRCIFMCLPGYEEHCTAETLRPWGYEQEEILSMMLRTIETLGLTKLKFTMIAHDWGAYFALLFTTRHPHIISKLVLCDIGMCTPFSLQLTSIPPIAFYQLFFAVTYFISQTISLQIAEWLFLSIGIKAFFNILSPPHFSREEIPQASLTVRKCYPYYYLWRRLLTGRMLPQSFPTCPVLYLVRLSSPTCAYCIFNHTMRSVCLCALLLYLSGLHCILC